MDFEGDSTLLWQRRYAGLVGWYETHGNCNVPKAEGKLGRWVVRQRELNKKGKLEPGRKARLDELGFVWNTNEAAWQARFNILRDYASRHGHCCVPISDPSLGMWVAKMRANKRRNKLPEHRRQLLDNIGFIWNTAEADWMDRLEKLHDFRRSVGHSCVPFNEGELGWWVNTQRQSKRKGKLSAERERLLNEADFIWNPQEFLARRRREAHSARARAQSALVITSSEHLKRCANLAFTSDASGWSTSPDTRSPKRGKLVYSIPATPKRKPLFMIPMESAATSGSEYSRLTGRDSPGSEAGTLTPVSNVTFQQLNQDRNHAQSPAESMSSTRMTRVDVSSIASLLSPAPVPVVSVVRSQYAHRPASVIGNLVSALPHFQRDRSRAAQARRKSALNGLVIPPISSLMQFMVKSSN